VTTELKLIIIIIIIIIIICVAAFTLDAGLLAGSQYPGGLATGHLETGFSWFPCV